MNILILFILSKLLTVYIKLDRQFSYSVNVKKNIMNLKERGITVGDLILFLIFLISTVLIINKVKENDKQVYFQIAPYEILTAKKT